MKEKRIMVVKIYDNVKVSYPKYEQLKKPKSIGFLFTD